MLHQSGVIVYNNSYLWLNLVYVVALACYCGLCEVINKWLCNFTDKDLQLVALKFMFKF